MPFDFPNIVPENNLRLPDALTIKYGPAPLLARFLLAADRAARRKGIFLRVRHDFDGLADINKYYVARDLWYPLLDGFNPQHADLRPENAVWISGENDKGEVVLSHATRVCDWTGTNLAEQANVLWYGHDAGQRCVVTADVAQQITGVVAWGGALWIHPTYRTRHLANLVTRVGKAYAFSRWPIDWSICYVSVENARRGLAKAAGHNNLSYSILYPDSPHGEQVIGYSTAQEFSSDLADFMDGGGILQEDDFDSTLESIREHMLTNTSPEPVFHGNMSRS